MKPCETLRPHQSVVPVLQHFVQDDQLPVASKDFDSMEDHGKHSTAYQKESTVPGAMLHTQRRRDVAVRCGHLLWSQVLPGGWHRALHTPFSYCRQRPCFLPVRTDVLLQLAKCHMTHTPRLFKDVHWWMERIIPVGKANSSAPGFHVGECSRPGSEGRVTDYMMAASPT
jgi:hypothetical protein